MATGNRAPADLFVRACAAASPHSLAAWKWAEELNAQADSARGEPLNLALDLLNAYEGLGMISPEDFTTSRWQHRHLLAEREAVMVLGNASSLWRFSSADDFRLMPFFSPVDGKGYFFISPLISLAVGKQVVEDPAKAEAVDRILEYITSEEGQLDLMSMDKGIISPILGMREIDGMDFYQDVKSKLTDETLLHFPKFPRCVDALNTELGDCLWGDLNPDGLAEALDAANREPQGDELPAVAVAEADFTSAETNALALDAMKAALDTDVALLRQKPKGQRYDDWFLCGVFYEGAVTETDLLCIQPLVENPKSSRPLTRVEMTGAQLLELLSYEGAYYYNGVTVRWQEDKDMGTSTALALLDGGGREIGPEERLTVAVLPQSPLREDQYLSRENSGVTLWTALTEYMRERQVLTPVSPNPAVYE
mgnify:CR=1 FL=1